MKSGVLSTTEPTNLSQAASSKAVIAIAISQLSDRLAMVICLPAWTAPVPVLETTAARGSICIVVMAGWLSTCLFKLSMTWCPYCTINILCTIVGSISLLLEQHTTRLQAFTAPSSTKY